VPFLRIFPLSFAILWRFLLVLPLWIVFYTILSVLAAFGVLELLGSIPVLGIFALFALPLVLMAITYTISVHPYLIGIGIGLRSRGIKTDPSQGRLIKAAIIYGLIESILAYILLVVLFAASILVLKTEVAWASALYVDQIPDPMTALSRQIAFGTLTVLSLLSNIAVMCLRAALLPSFAGAAAGTDPDGRPHSLLDGFGTSFVLMMLTLLLITVISSLIIPFAGDAISYVGLTSILTSQLDQIVLYATSDQAFSFTLRHAMLIVLAILLSIWLFCLQCAGAVLSYECRSKQKPIFPGAPDPEPVATSVDLAELRRSRMPKHHS